MGTPAGTDLFSRRARRANRNLQRDRVTRLLPTGTDPSPWASLRKPRSEPRFWHADRATDAAHRHTVLDADSIADTPLTKIRDELSSCDRGRPDLAEEL